MSFLYQHKGLDNIWLLSVRLEMIHLPFWLHFLGQSVELLMLRSLPQGSYVVPIIIQDRQGFSTRQNQHIRLCFCPDGHTCKNSPVLQAAVGLGSGAIVIILVAFLLLLGKQPPKLHMQVLCHLTTGSCCNCSSWAQIYSNHDCFASRGWLGDADCH